MKFTWHNPSDVTQEFIESWRQLAMSASSPNFYLTPDFVLPAIRHLAPDDAPKLAVVWNEDCSIIMALSVFNAVPPSIRFPYLRQRAFKTKHTYQTGILLRPSVEDEALDTLFKQLLDEGCRAIEFGELREDASAYAQLQRCARRLGLHWFVDDCYERATLKSDDKAQWRDHVSKSRHANVRRSKSQLSKLGKLEINNLMAADVSDAEIENFLHLESLGWKADSSLRATAEGEAFIREVTDYCRANNSLWMCEVSLGGKAIATILTFCLGAFGFTFKIGMNPEYSKWGPGILAEYSALECWEDGNPSLEDIDSGAQAGCFIEDLWPSRSQMVSGHFVHGLFPVAFAKLKQTVKNSFRVAA